MSDVTKDLENFFCDEDAEDTQKDKFFAFTVGTEDYGIDIRCVTEIIGNQNITDMLDMPGHIKGVINLRGKVIPILSRQDIFSGHYGPNQGALSI